MLVVPSQRVLTAHSHLLNLKWCLLGWNGENKEMCDYKDPITYEDVLRSEAQNNDDLK